MLHALIYLDPDDVIDGQPLADHVLRFLKQRGIRNAAIFRSVRGFGARHHLLDSPPPIGTSSEQPVMITMIDTPEKVRNVLMYVKTIIGDGAIITHPVEAW
ncbi:MAG: DUF190 domain-containing protein [Bacteroidetes bacterium]|nr:DUF190 domain-containing protein [Bacteroidota bacterium]